MSGNLIRLFLVDGKANSMRTVEISNMTYTQPYYQGCKWNASGARHGQQARGLPAFGRRHRGA